MANAFPPKLSTISSYRTHSGVSIAHAMPAQYHGITVDTELQEHPHGIAMQKDVNQQIETSGHRCTCLYRLETISELAN